MFYYTIIQHKKDGNNPTSTTIKETKDDAREQLYYDMWYAINQKDSFNKVMAYYVDEIGNVIELLKFENEDEPTPNVEPSNEEVPTEPTGE